MTITCRPLRSFFLFSFCFIFLMHVCKNYTSIAIYEKIFFSVHPHSYTRKNFFLYTHVLLKTLSLYINMVYIKTLFLFKDFFFVFQHTLVAYTKISLYTLVAHTQEFLSTHHLHTQKSFYTHFPFTGTGFTQPLISPELVSYVF